MNDAADRLDSEKSILGEQAEPEIGSVAENKIGYDGEQNQNICRALYIEVD